MSEKIIHEWEINGQKLRIVITDKGPVFRFYTGAWLDHETDKDLLVKTISFIERIEQLAARVKELEAQVDNLQHGLNKGDIETLIIMATRRECRATEKLAEIIQEDGVGNCPVTLQLAEFEQDYCKLDSISCSHEINSTECWLKWAREEAKTEEAE